MEIVASCSMKFGSAATWGRREHRRSPETAIPGLHEQRHQANLATRWCTLTDGLAGEHVKQVAETVPANRRKKFSKLAAELGIYVTVPLIEVDAKSGKFFNTVVVMDPVVKVAIHYRKKNPCHSPSADGQAMAISAIP